MGIVYRDLKPENVLIQDSGHVTLTDFDLSRALSPRTMKTLLMTPETHALPEPHRRSFTRLFPASNSNKKREPNKKRGLKKAKSARVSPVSRRRMSFSSGERSNSFVGTEEYVSPEVVRGDGHEFAVDWWALGILSYEMLYGHTPFRGKNRKETFSRVLMMPPEFIGRPSALTDLIGKLLEKDPTRRLGYRRGACEIKEHEFFNGLRWDLLTEVSRPPYLPSNHNVELTEEGLTKGGFHVSEYFEKLRVPTSPLNSPSLDHLCRNVSLTEF